MRGFRQVGILAIAAMLVLIIVLTGCEKTGMSVSTVERRPIVDTVELYGEEPYTVTETLVVGEKCVERHTSELNDSRFNLSIDDAEWIGEKIPGETNYLRRKVHIYNGLDEIDTVWLDKIYLYDGTETKRSRTPMKFLVDPKSVRTLYVMWNTQYDPLKDVTVDFTNNTEYAGYETHVFRLCVNETEKVNTTEYRKIVTGTAEEVVGYDEVVRVKLPRK